MVRRLLVYVLLTRMHNVHYILQHSSNYSGIINGRYLFFSLLFWMYSRWMREWLLKKRYTEKGFIQTDTKKKNKFDRIVFIIWHLSGNRIKRKPWIACSNIYFIFFVVMWKKNETLAKKNGWIGQNGKWRC